MKEEELISLIRSEKTRLKGYAIIVDTYQERLYWHVRSMVGSHDNANDVLQNTFIKVWKGLSGFRGDSKLYTWLYRIASNEAVSFIQKEKRRFGSSDEESTSEENNNNEDQNQFLKLVKDITSKGFVRSDYKRKLVDLSDIRINLKGKK